VPPPNWQGPPPPEYAAPSPPALYQNVVAEVPSDNQILQVGQVAVVGRDESQPVDSQDTFLLDDSTIAWGQVVDPSSGAQIRVSKTQSLPGFGPTDNGDFLVALAVRGEPPQPVQPAPTAQPWWPWAVRYGLLVMVVVVIAGLLNRRGKSDDADKESATESRH
jgi:hypothetical protein